ncbi:Transmembrane protein [Parasponia andersonii]|uniref:Transmembrane protein n=1 Tax=Parasponia andersonii TaxID=3476 RepID=A0A2P5CRR6_PARAD|nr:Transmembrane protein [Parasponia andersonii]
MAKEDESADVDTLFEAVMKNNWNDVISTYSRSSNARAAKLTKLGDTALHIAVSNGKTDIASKMVDVIEDSVLTKSANVKGNTPLHLAAMYGNLDICKKLALRNKDLITHRNRQGETPIFLAALYGKQSVFLYLHNSEFDIKEECLRSNNGDTILHVAISGEYFGIAMLIIEKYQNLVDSVNVDGLSPLHILANKPNAFKSSTCLGLFDRIMYYCLVVDDGDMEKAITCDKIKIDKDRKKHSSGEESGKPNYPGNYETCMDFGNILRTIITTALKKGSMTDDNEADEENPQENISSSEHLGPSDNIDAVGSEPKSAVQESSASSSSTLSSSGKSIHYKTKV